MIGVSSTAVNGKPRRKPKQTSLFYTWFQNKKHYNYERARSQFVTEDIMDSLQNINPSFYDDVRNIIIEARTNAIRSVDFHRILMYWRIGERTFERLRQP